MELRLALNLDLPSFQKKPTEEIARVLRHYADNLEKGTVRKTLRDQTGRIIGYVELTK